METKNVNNNEGAEVLHTIEMNGVNYSYTTAELIESFKTKWICADMWWKDLQDVKAELQELRNRIETMKPMLEKVNMYNLFNLL